MIAGCQNQCEQSKWAKSINVSARGSDNPDILEIGEAPGRDEDINGVCFVGAAGQRLDSYNYKAAITEVVRITNVTRCCPYENSKRKKIGKPTKATIKQCAQQYLIPEIIRYRPKLLVPMGDKAWSFFGTGKISAVQGSFRPYTIKAEDYPLLLNEDLVTPLLPTFHPAYALRGNVAADKAIQEDLVKARQFIKDVDKPTGNYVYYDNLDLIDQLADWIVATYKSGGFKYSAVSCDLECEGKDWRLEDKNIVGVGFSWEAGSGVFIPFNGNRSPWKNDYGVLLRIRNALKRIFDAVPIIGQYFEFDRRWLWFHLGLKVNLLFDTLSAHKWLYQDTRPHSLEYMAGAYTDLFMHKMEAQVAGAYDDENMTNIDPQIVTRLCAGDCDATLRVYEVLRDKIENERNSLNEFYTWNMEPINEMFGLDAAGAYMDMDENNRLRKYFKKRMLTTAEEIHSLKLNGVNLDEHFIKTYNEEGSKKPLSILLSGQKRNVHLLYTMLGLPMPKKDLTSKTQLKNIVRKLDEQFPHPDNWDGVTPPMEIMEWYLCCKKVIEAILSYKSAQGMVSKYTDAFEKFRLADGCVHPEHHIAATVTGRPSVTEPPAATLPKTEEGKFKRAFVTRFHNGLLYNGDESQIEVRCLAYYSQDPKMLELFVNDEDMHRLVGSRFFGKMPHEITKDERNMIKSVVFGMFYGRSDAAISEDTGIKVDLVAGIVKAFWEMFSVADQWRESTVWFAKQHGGVYGAQKRWRYLPHINNMDDRKLMGEAERQAINTPIQGLASDFAQNGIVRTMRRMRREQFGSIPFQTVYDSFGIDVYPGDLLDLISICEYEFVAKAHELFPWWNVPFKFEHEIGFNLKDMVEISVSNGMIESEPCDTPDILNAIADAVSSWYNAQHVFVDENEGKYRLSITLDSRRKVDRGDQWLAWSDDKFKTPALQPYCYKRWTQF